MKVKNKKASTSMTTRERMMKRKEDLAKLNVLKVKEAIELLVKEVIEFLKY